jgi:alkaline phosphatase
MKKAQPLTALAVASVLAAGAQHAAADPTISRLTPPSNPISLTASTLARFVPGQKFDLQATVRPDASQKTITKVEFFVDGISVGVANAPPTVGVTSSLVPATAITASFPNSVAASVRGYSNLSVGVHALTAQATQSDGAVSAVATGNFEIEPITQVGRKAKNIIILLGDGMGASHRTAARIVLNGYAQGKTNAKLAMDTFPNTAMIMTASLDTIVTDSAPGMSNYVTGNKANSSQEGVWPDDTTATFDNPRFEYLSELLTRTQGKKLGLVTTADVFDATPAANAVHTSNRNNGTGIVDQYLDDSGLTNLTVLLGGGRKWFLPNTTGSGTGSSTDTCANNASLQTCLNTNQSAVFNGSARTPGTDYTLPADIIAGWTTASGAIDPARDLIGDFQAAGWSYVPDSTALNNVVPANTAKLLGLFALSNMNIAKDKIDGRRGNPAVVNDYGFPNQPMLDEMADKALRVLDAKSPNGFVLMVEGASIDKQSHQMDSTRWIGDTIEFDKAVQKAKDFVDGKNGFAPHPDTLVIVTADHECSGAVIIGASTQTNAGLLNKIASEGANSGTSSTLNGRPVGQFNALNQSALRNDVVGTYNLAGFPKYTILPDGYPADWDPDHKLLVGYGANGDRFENYRTRPQPTNDSQQPADGVLPLLNYPRNNYADGGAIAGRPLQQADGWFITGQVPGDQAVHTGGDIPLSAYGRGAALLGGTLDNTDVFFALTQAAIGGAVK